MEKIPSKFLPITNRNLVNCYIVENFSDYLENKDIVPHKKEGIVSILEGKYTFQNIFKGNFTKFVDTEVGKIEIFDPNPNCELNFFYNIHLKHDVFFDSYSSFINYQDIYSKKPFQIMNPILYYYKKGNYKDEIEKNYGIKDFSFVLGNMSEPPSKNNGKRIKLELSSLFNPQLT